MRIDRLTRSGLVAALALAGCGLCLAACGSEESSTGQLAPLAVETQEGALNQAPVVRAVRLEPAQPTQDDRLRAVANVHDPEGDKVELSYRWRVDGLPVLGESPTLDLADVAKGARVEVVVTASDGRSEGEPASAVATVIDRPPVLNGIALQPTQSVYPGDKVVVTPTGSDPDGDFVDFEIQWLVNGRPVNGDGRSFETAGLKKGDRIRVRVVATDGNGESAPLESADILVGSAHPEIVSSPPGITEEGVFRYAVEARDPDGDRNLRYRLAEGPEGMKIDEVLGEVEWRPGENQAGLHKVSIVVRDSSRLETTQSFEVTVSRAGEPPPAPAASSE
jgi:hypothetical protein